MVGCFFFISCVLLVQRTRIVIVRLIHDHCRSHWNKQSNGSRWNDCFFSKWKFINAHFDELQRIHKVYYTHNVANKTFPRKVNIDDCLRLKGDYGSFRELLGIVHKFPESLNWLFQCLKRQCDIDGNWIVIFLSIHRRQFLLFASFLVFYEISLMLLENLANEMGDVCSSNVIVRLYRGVVHRSRHFCSFSREKKKTNFSKSPHPINF